LACVVQPSGVVLTFPSAASIILKRNFEMPVQPFRNHEKSGDAASLLTPSCHQSMLSYS
jgi:hypothetical protein